MNLQEFAENVVKKTLFIDTESWRTNKSHMALGLASEYCSELHLAEINKNILEVSEEIGDAIWFIIGWMLFENLEIPKTIKISPKNKNTPIDTLLRVSIGDLCTVVKKEIISGQPKLNGKILTSDDKLELAENVLSGLYLKAQHHRLNVEGSILPMIAKKLNVRYAGGGFDPEKSLNRDLHAESDAMQSVLEFTE